MARTAIATATADVANRDPVLARFVDEVGPISYPHRSTEGPFASLVRAIVFQQLAGRAAHAILGRVQDAVGGVPSPEALAATSDQKLRAAGLSGNKLAALRDLSTKTMAGEVKLTPRAKDSDDAVIESLVGVRGIGRWTAEMFLMFQVRRLDIWPVDDLGVRQGYAAIWDLDSTPTARELEPLGERFRPYRSIVALYCWQAAALARGTPTSLR